MDSLKVSWSILPGIILASAFSWGIGTVAAFITVFFRDVKHVIEVGSQVFYFLTPILYHREQVLDKNGLGFIADLNPVNTYLELIRTPLIDGVVPSPGMYLYGLGTAVVAVLLGAGTTAWLKQRVIFHLILRTVGPILFPSRRIFFERAPNGQD
ncbi:MAG: ABC transporter permease [Gemmataceae bacterium]